MQTAHKNRSGGLELARLTLASLAVWLAVTCLVAGNRMRVATATATAGTMAAGTIAVSASPVDLAENLPAEPVGDEVAAADDVEVAAKARHAVVRTATLTAVAAAPAGANRFVFPED